jgi:TRAP transporter TAXI family solute receptor
MRNRKLVLLLSFVILVILAPAAWPASQQKKAMTLATASIGGAYYPMGQALSTIINKYVPDISVTPEVTNGAVENPRLVGDGNTDFGITNANTAYFAFNGEKPYTKKIENIAALGNLHPSVFHFVVLNRSDIKSFADLKGKKVAVGPAGGGTLPILQSILAEYGMKMDDIKANYLPYTDGFTQLGDNNLDAAVALGGYPMAAVMEIGATQKIRLIVLEEPRFKDLIAKYPYYSEIIVPRDVYKQEKDIPCIGINNIFFTKKSMDSKIVYDVTKAIYDHLDELSAAFDTARQIDRKALSQTPIPLHPGAKKYFDEKK